MSQSQGHQPHTNDFIHILFTVLVPNCNEDSVDIYDGLEVIPSSSPGWWSGSEYDYV